MKKLLIVGMINLLLLNIVLAEDKWEYKIYIADNKSQYKLTQTLNNIGNQGWELITVNAYQGSWKHQAFFIFKKKIENEDD